MPKLCLWRGSCRCLLLFWWCVICQARVVTGWVSKVQKRSSVSFSVPATRSIVGFPCNSHIRGSHVDGQDLSSRVSSTSTSSRSETVVWTTTTNTTTNEDDPGFGRNFPVGAAVRRNPQAVLVVDLENVRGKSGFALQHRELVLDLLLQWTRACQISEQVVVAVDHGSQDDAFWVTSSDNDDDDSACGDDDAGMAVVFAGPMIKADDVIARDVSTLLQIRKRMEAAQNASEPGKEATTSSKRPMVLVVTADQGLIRRCRKSVPSKALQILSPQSLLDDLEQLQQHPRPMVSQLQSPFDRTEISFNDDACTEHEAAVLYLAAQWMQAHAKLKAARGKHIPHKRRKYLHHNVQHLTQQLKATSLGSQMHDFAIANVIQQDEMESDNNTNHGLAMAEPGVGKAPVVPLAAHLQSAMLNERDQLQSKQRRHQKHLKEKTQDRVVLAEHLRAELEASYGTSTAQVLAQVRDNGVSSHTSIAQAYIADWVLTRGGTSAKQRHQNVLSNQTDDTAVLSPRSPLRLVVLSDTHGYQDDVGATLPDGDVLLHLGDFCLEGPAKTQSVQAVDRWLASFPHPYKIVLRGNHDPRGSGIVWKHSCATFVTQPQTVVIGGYKLALLPFMSRYTTTCLPNRCDVVVSHVPPKGVLDICTTGKSAGSHALRRRLRQLCENNATPALVLCGHIHEARGWVWHDFSKRNNDSNGSKDTDDKEGDQGNPRGTLVVNAALANPGFARSIEHGPVVVELSRTSDLDDQAERGLTAKVTMNP